MDKVTLVITVLNEEHTLDELLWSIEAQTRLPDEVVCIDGGSSDTTYDLIQQWAPAFNIQTAQKVGNRSIGRNEAIRLASNSIIAITDAGCTLEKTWLEEIVKPVAKGFDVVAGYYRSGAKTAFQRAAAPYMLVMPDRIDPKNFLPATRSMALTKAIWKKAGTFPEQFTYNEDYVFAHKLREIHAKMTFTDKAVVVWQPPSNILEFVRQVYRFAVGDMQASIVRPKVLLIFARYIVACAIAYVSPILAAVLFVVYIAWAVKKNYRYVEPDDGVYLLPLLQLTTDVAVMIGSIAGLVKRIMHEIKH